jgi:type IV secretory pathway VirB10-like protein
MNILGKEYPKIGRINRRVLIVVAAVICLLFFLAFLRGVGNQGARKRTVEEKKNVTSNYNDWIPSNLTYADVLKENKLPGSGFEPSGNDEIDELRREIEKLKQSMRDKKRHQSFAEMAKTEFEKPVEETKQPPTKKPPEKKDNSLSKQQKLEQEANDSAIFFSNKSGKLTGAGFVSTNESAPTGIDQAQQRLIQLQNNLQGSPNQIGATVPNLGELGLPGFGAEDELVSQNNQKEKREFMEKSVDPDKVYNRDKLHTPLSPYELKAGSVVPCTLVTGLNSDLPGMIKAQVRETVYDSVNGQHMLIPQGSTMVGSYDSIITYGQERTLIVFNRIILPNGNSISLENFKGIDLQGYSGLTDKVNNHWFKILGSVVVSGVLQGMADLADDSDEYSLNDGEIIASSVSSEVADTAAKVVNKQINIQPTLEIRPGWNFNVFVEKDVILQPFHG